MVTQKREMEEGARTDVKEKQGQACESLGSVLPVDGSFTSAPALDTGIGGTSIEHDASHVQYLFSASPPRDTMPFPAWLYCKQRTAPLCDSSNSTTRAEGAWGAFGIDEARFRGPLLLDPYTLITFEPSTRTAIMFDGRL